MSYTPAGAALAGVRDAAATVAASQWAPVAAAFAAGRREYERYAIVRIAPPADGTWRFADAVTYQKQPDGKRRKNVADRGDNRDEITKQPLDTQQPLAAFVRETTASVGNAGNVRRDWVDKQVYALATLEAWHRDNAGRRSARVPGKQATWWFRSPPQAPPLAVVPAPAPAPVPAPVPALVNDFDALYGRLRALLNEEFRDDPSESWRITLPEIFKDAAENGTIIVERSEWKHEPPTFTHQFGKHYQVHKWVRQAVPRIDALHWFERTFFTPPDASGKRWRTTPVKDGDREPMVRLQYYEWPGGTSAGIYDFTEHAKTIPRPDDFRFYVTSDDDDYVDDLQEAVRNAPTLYNLYKFIVSINEYIDGYRTDGGYSSPYVFSAVKERTRNGKIERALDDVYVDFDARQQAGESLASIIRSLPVLSTRYWSVLRAKLQRAIDVYNYRKHCGEDSDYGDYDSEYEEFGDAPAAKIGCRACALAARMLAGGGRR